jgi:hypothetical protein
LRAGRNQQEIARFLKRAQVPGLPFEECFEPKPGCWVGRCHSCPKLKQKMSLASHGQWILWPGHPKQCQNHPGLAEGQPEGPLVQGNLAYQLKINTKKVFWPHKDSGFCGLATQNIAKIAQDWLKANLKDHWSKEIWPPSSKDCNPLVISCGAKLRERLINGLITPWPPSRP